MTRQSMERFVTTNWADRLHVKLDMAMVERTLHMGLPILPWPWMDTAVVNESTGTLLKQTIVLNHAEAIARMAEWMDPSVE